MDLLYTYEKLINSSDMILDIKSKNKKKEDSKRIFFKKSRNRYLIMIIFLFLEPGEIYKTMFINRLFFKSFLMNRESDVLKNLKIILHGLNNKYNVNALIRHNCFLLKQELKEMSSRIFSPAYQALVYYFIGKWINKYFIRNIEITGKIIYNKDLDFSNESIGSDGNTIVCSLLHNNTDIKLLNLSNNSLNSQDFFRLKGVSTNFNNILSLTLDNNNLNEESANFTFDIIINSPRLKFLELNNINKFGYLDNLFKSNYKNNRFKIEDLSLRDNNLSHLSGNLLITFIENFSNLRSLNLGNNNLGSGFFPCLEKFFKKKRQIISLILDNNRFNDGNVENLCEAIKSSSTLVLLNLDKNDFTNKGAIMILESLKELKKIRKLSMNSNLKIQSFQLQSLIKSIVKLNKNLAFIDLSSETKEGKKIIKENKNETEIRLDFK